jgi:hypothetical protein
MMNRGAGAPRDAGPPLVGAPIEHRRAPAWGPEPSRYPLSPCDGAPVEKEPSHR